jgi:hypothetical protein
VFIRPERSAVVRLVAVLWQLRTELAVTAVVVWCWLWLTRRLPVWAALTVVLASAAMVLVWSPSRRFVVGHAWCTVTRHRLRACMVQSRIMNHHGYVPWLLWVRPTNVGERAWLLMRPGICVEDVETSMSEIAAACWARDARVRAVRRLVALVLVDVVRRDPLTADRLIGSPLARASGDSVPARLPGLPLHLLTDEHDRLHKAAGLGAVGQASASDDAVEDWELGRDASSAVLVDPPVQAGTGSKVPLASVVASSRRARPVDRPTGPEAVASSSGEDVSDYV